MIAFRPFGLYCVLLGLWLELRYGATISGHDFIECEDASLLCRVCGEVST